MDINKLSEERTLMVQQAEKEKESLADIQKEIKKRKDYIHSLHLLEESKYDNNQARTQYSGLLRILKKYKIDLEQTSRFSADDPGYPGRQPGTGVRAERRRPGRGGHRASGRQGDLP